jgi:hypothetical protein
VKRLEQALDDYLRIRRSLEYRLREPEGLLRNFVASLQAERAPYITRQLALRWATQPAKAQPATWAGRLGIIRRFAIWHSATNHAPKFPPQAFSRIATDASPLTSIVMKRSKTSFAEVNNSPLPTDFAPALIRPFSARW